MIALPTQATWNSMAKEVSPGTALTLRVRIWYSAKPSAVSSGSSSAQCGMPRPGRITISTPAKPATTALQRRQPTRSPSSGIENTVTSSGAMKVIV